MELSSALTGSAKISFNETPPLSVLSKQRLEYLDIAKGFAAISVVLLHLFSASELFSTLAFWHIWQAVPIFMFAAGITGYLSCQKYSGIMHPINLAITSKDLITYYGKLPKKIFTLYLPYICIVIIYHLWHKEPLGIQLFFNTMLMGYLGPGGYFVPLIVQHLIFFPLALVVRGKLASDAKFLIFSLVISCIAEGVFSLFSVESTKFIYRIFYVRYFFICCLGAVFFTTDVSCSRIKKIIYASAALSTLYMITILIFNTPATQTFWNLPFIRADDWYFQHYPAFFYTVCFVFVIRTFMKYIPFSSFFVILGKSSYDIFIFQMLFFITVVLTFTNGKSWLTLPLVLKMGIFIICVLGGLVMTKIKTFSTPFFRK